MVTDIRAGRSMQRVSRRSPVRAELDRGDAADAAGLLAPLDRNNGDVELQDEPRLDPLSRRGGCRLRGQRLLRGRILWPAVPELRGQRNQLEVLSYQGRALLRLRQRHCAVHVGVRDVVVPRSCLHLSVELPHAVSVAKAQANQNRVRL
eukprot:2365740-Prymnesium_polylepis.1